MSAKANGVAVPARNTHDAADGQRHCTPSDAEALAVGHALLGLMAALGIGARSTTYDQHSLPPGCRSQGVYLERHRAAVKEKLAGWTRTGKVRSVTAEAWAASVDAETRRPPRHAPKLALVPSVGDEMDAALGIRTKAANVAELLRDARGAKR